MQLSSGLLAVLPLLALCRAQDTCPNGSGAATINNTPICCPGVATIVDGTVACCVGGDIGDPTCGDFGDSSSCPPTSPCQTIVPVTASGYSSIVYGSMAASAAASTTAASQSATAAASTGNGSAPGPSSAPPATSGPTNASPSASTKPSSSSSKAGAAAAVVTQGPILVMAGLAGLAMI